MISRDTAERIVFKGRCSGCEKFQGCQELGYFGDCDDFHAEVRDTMKALGGKEYGKSKKD